MTADDMINEGSPLATPDHEPLPPDTKNGPTESDEGPVLSDMYGASDDQGVYRRAVYSAGFSVAAVLAPVGTDAMLAEARKTLGMGEPNKIQRWYQSRNGNAFAGNWAWCQASVTYWSSHSGNYAQVCPRGDRAYTVYGAEDGQYLKLWYAGTVENIKAHCKPGAIVYFDWSGSNNVGAVDHVGVVEHVLSDGRVQTIEGNTSDMCARRVRSAGDIAGFWNPAYVKPTPEPQPESKPAPKPTAPKVTVPGGNPYLKRGSRGTRVKQLQRALNAVRKAGLSVDGEYGPKTGAAVRAFQRFARLTVDGVYGPRTAAALKKAAG